MGPYHNTAGPGVGKWCWGYTPGNGLPWGFSIRGSRGGRPRYVRDTGGLKTANPFIQPSSPGGLSFQPPLSVLPAGGPCRDSMKEWLVAYTLKQIGFGC